MNDQSSAPKPSGWVTLLIKPSIVLATGAMLIFGLGVAQRTGWVSAGGGSGSAANAASTDTRTYICPMLCTPPQIGPGRCPVCEMELVPAASGGGPSDSVSVNIDPVARRVANIQTAAAERVPLRRSIRAVGALRYDEGSMKSLSAYVDGRLDRLYADFTGVEVTKGDRLALVYSPRLYSAQVELLLARKADANSQDSTFVRVREANLGMYQSTRQRLIELGMTDDQIDELEASGEADSRLALIAPISGTVIEKHAVEGQYVKEGQPIYELADLSNVWLMLDLFPEDAVAIRYGQRVEATVQSLPGRTFTGRVAFIDPMVDPTKRTVGVRVVVPNEQRLLRIGDFAKATIDAPLATSDESAAVYDPELAGKWISPRHPQVIENEPGKCRLCGVELVPATALGFTNEPAVASESLVVPRSAVLVAGDDAVLYVETDPGRFEIRNVTLGARSGDKQAILDGLSEGEQVAVSGAFLIDSQMQLSGNPSLIDPTKAITAQEFDLDEESMPPIGVPMLVAEAAGAVPMPAMTVIGPIVDVGSPNRDDAALIAQQGVCPVTGASLGSMGPPIKVVVEGRPVFLCCEGCRKRLLADPDKYLSKLDDVGSWEAKP